VLAYLSRYTHRVAISNRRLISLDERGVTFRWKDYRVKGRTRHKTMTLNADEFMRRFLLHVLPSGFHRIRHYGLIANAGCKENLARVRELLLPEAPRVDAMLITAEASGDPIPPTFVCPCCGAAMIIIDTLVRGQPIRAPPQQRAAA
jgi:Putative transposase